MCHLENNVFVPVALRTLSEDIRRYLAVKVLLVNQNVGGLNSKICSIYLESMRTEYSPLFFTGIFFPTCSTFSEKITSTILVVRVKIDNRLIFDLFPEMQTFLLVVSIICDGVEASRPTDMLIALGDLTLGVSLLIQAYSQKSLRFSIKYIVGIFRNLIMWLIRTGDY